MAVVWPLECCVEGHPSPSGASGTTSPLLGASSRALPFVLAWVCWNGPAWDLGCDCTTVKEYVPVCLSPPCPRTGVNQPR